VQGADWNSQIKLGSNQFYGALVIMYNAVHVLIRR
jgi:hypothetical protein